MKKQDKQPLDFRIGEKVLVDLEGTGKRFWTEAYGRIRGEYILLRHPMNVAFKDLLGKDQPITARYMDTEGSIFGFKSRVVGAIAKPSPMLVITHPFTIETVNLRRHDRVQCFLPSSLFHEGEEMAGYIVNISAGGAKFVWPMKEGQIAEFPKDAEAFCQFRMPGAENELYARSIIKATTLDTNRCIIGIKFEDLEEEHKRLITDYVQLAVEFMAS
ncbi:MAG: flagellar brake protein [Thermodesulfobacteriota bacterium]